MKDIFFNSELFRDSDSYNKEAGFLFNSNYSNFEEKVIEFSEESRKKENLILEENFLERSKIFF